MIYMLQALLLLSAVNGQSGRARAIPRSMNDSSPVRIIAELPYAFAHEAPVHDAVTNTLYFVSNRLYRPDGSQHVEINKIELDTQTLTRDLPIAVPMVNGAWLLSPQVLLLCGQGNFDEPAGIYHVDLSTMKSHAMVTSWNGLPFNSPNDLVVDSFGYVWFTDPPYGFAQGFRPEPQMGNCVWRARLIMGRLVDVEPIITEGLHKPNGIAVSSDGLVLYVTDSGYINGDGTFDPDKPHCIYAYDIVNNLATNRRTFVVASLAGNGVPDGMKLKDFSLFYGNGDGVHIVDTRTAKEVRFIPVEGGVANFALVGSSIYMLNENRVLVADL